MRERSLLLVLAVLLAGVWSLGGVAIVRARVEGSDYLYIQRNQIRSEGRSFAPLKDLNCRFDPSEGLPYRAVDVRVVRLAGTGPVSVVEQPGRQNDYTLKLLVDNENEDEYPQEYRFRLEWDDVVEREERPDPERFDTLHWEGVVDGSDILQVHGRTVDVTHILARPVQKALYEFSSSLPEREVPVRLQVLRGRGRVDLIQQPSISNGFTAQVRLDDERQNGADTYEILLFWPRTRGPERAASYDMVWEGKVDGSDNLVVRGKEVRLEHLTARPVTGERCELKRRLPRREGGVRLDVLEGRGRVEIVEQPSGRNDYTLKILLDDVDRKGAGFYRIGLSWGEDDDRRGPVRGAGLGTGHGAHVEPPQTPSGGVIRWRGVVDGRDRLTFLGSDCRVEHLEAAPLRDMNVTFSSPLPPRDMDVKLNRISGRADARIIEQPSRRNGYRLVVEVDDPGRGAARLELELVW